MVQSIIGVFILIVIVVFALVFKYMAQQERAKHFKSRRY